MRILFAALLALSAVMGGTLALTSVSAPAQAGCASCG